MNEILRKNQNLNNTELIDQLREKLAIGRVTEAARVFLSRVREELVQEANWACSLIPKSVSNMCLGAKNIRFLLSPFAFPRRSV